MALQESNAPPPMRRYINRHGGALGGNDFYYGANPSNYGRNQYYSNRDYPSNYGRNQYYSNRGNQFNYRRNQYNRPNYYPRNVYYNRNYQPQQRYDNGGPPGRFIRPVRSNEIQSRRRSGSNRPNSRDNRPRSQIRQRRRGPGNRVLDDFMPTGLRQPQRNLPPGFNVEATRSRITNAPPDALPQRERFATRNTTQPFVVVNQDNQQPQQQRQQRPRRTTSSYRRREGRNNRFAVLANDDDDLIELMDIKDEPMPFNKKNNKKKTRLYLDSNRILKWLEDHSRSSKNAISGRGNQKYVLASTSIYDDWVRNNYELQVWQAYLKMGKEQKHWAKEVVQRTKRRDDVVNTRFVQKKINQLTANISEASAAISDLQIQLSTYWIQTTSEATNQRLAQTIANRITPERTRQTTTATAVAAATVATDTDDDISTIATIAPTTTTKNQAREPVDRIEKYILEYIHYCTQHVKKMAQTRIQLAKAQMEEFKALEDFEQIATATQWNLHLILKPRVKQWSIKNKNYQILAKRVELDLPPKFIDNIDKIDSSLKIDESIIKPDEAQVMYNQMRQITKDFRTQTMTLHVQSAARENEVLLNQIKSIVERFPQKNDDDGFDAEPGYAAFKQYHELREKRLNLEIEKSLYFLSEQRVVGIGNNNQQEEEEITAPTVVRSLGEDFLVPQ